MQAEAHALNIRRGSLSTRASRFHSPSHAAPDIGFVRYIHGKLKVGVVAGGRETAIRAIARLVVARRADSSRNRRILERAIDPHCCARLVKLRLRGLQGLIRNVDLFLKGI